MSESAAELLFTTSLCLLQCEALSEAKERRQKRMEWGTVLSEPRERVKSELHPSAAPP